MNPRIRRKLAKQERRTKRRLAIARKARDSGRPALRKTRAVYEIAERTQAISCGGIGVVHDLVLGSGLVEQLDARLINGVRKATICNDNQKVQVSMASDK